MDRNRRLLAVLRAILVVQHRVSAAQVDRATLDPGFRNVGLRFEDVSVGDQKCGVFADR